MNTQTIGPHGRIGVGQPTLADFIQTHMDDILREWNCFAQTLPPLNSASQAKLQDHAREILEAAAADLAQPQTVLAQKAKSEGRSPDNSPALKLAGANHAIARAADEFTLEQLIAEYRALRSSVLRLWAAQPQLCAGDLEEVTRFSESIDEALASSVRSYAQRHDDARTVLLGVLAHDLRNPLNVAMLSASYIIQDPTASVNTVQSAARVKRSVVRCEQLVSDLIDYACLELGPGLPTEPRDCNLQALCSVTVDEVEASYPGRVVTQAYTGNLNGRWDPARIAQLVGNLLINALKFGHDTEPVTLTVRGAADRVYLQVHNAGTPILAHELESIFIPLYLKPARGTKSSEGSSGLGLGLYICKEVATAHGGDLTMSSSLELGTTCRLTLPRNSLAQPASEATD